MATRTQVLIPIIAAAVIVGIIGMLSIPTDVKLGDVAFPQGTIKLDDKILQNPIHIPESLHITVKLKMW